MRVWLKGKLALNIMTDKGIGENRLGIPEPFYSEHKKCSYHRERAEKTDVCGCFYCYSVFSPNTIKKWIDSGQTALCPICNIDSVLPGVSSVKFLQEMGKHWFGTV